MSSSNLPHLREWQVEALDIWKTTLRGVVSVVTGGGKTVFALACMLHFKRLFPSGRTIIIVPTTALLDQWAVVLSEALGIAEHDVGLIGSGERGATGDESVVIAVVNSVRNPSLLPQAPDRMLIVDECHRAGSLENAKALVGDYKATLGLSATPTRDYDDGFETLVAPRIGPVIYEYDYAAAARDGIITPFVLKNIRIPLSPSEARAYQAVSRRIAIALRELPADDERIRALLIRRAAISYNAVARVPVAVRLLDLHRRLRTVVFHERIGAAQRIAQAAERRGHSVATYVTSLGPEHRRDNLRQFRKGLYEVLVSCRALDEGMNVPEASIAIIASSSASKRQRIQRLGRVLRPAKGKEAATIYTLYATNEERRRLVVEASSLMGTASVEWFDSVVPGIGQ